MAETTILVGIDEAGYGPILGPLVVSAAAFEAPTPPAGGQVDLWDVLKASVTQKPSGGDKRVAIADSKKVYQRSEGLGRLERSVLAVVGAWRNMPPDMAGLLELLCPGQAQRAVGHPWYASFSQTLPLEADGGGVRIASRMLARDATEQRVRVAGLWSEVLPEGDFNNQVGRTKNKATVLMGATLRLVYRVAKTYPGRELRFFIDKQGARDHYGGVLMKTFEDRHLRVIDEGAEQSAYELKAMSGAPMSDVGCRMSDVNMRMPDPAPNLPHPTSDIPHPTSSWYFHFMQGGESHHLPTALASMVSKYLRELFMHRFNAYWSGHIPDLKPTAGYYQDGQRFLKDIAPHLPRLGVVRASLVRVR